jgi:hypothetical protein
VEWQGRWVAVAACAVLAVVSFVGGLVFLTEGATRGFVSDWGWAALFGVSAVLLWRRVGWRRAGVVFGLLMLGFVVLYIVLVELHSGGKWPFSV